MKNAALAVLLLGLTVSARATGVTVPEIDANSAVAAIALVSGGLLVIRGRKR